MRLAGKYRLVRPAGFGGMAQLWVAHNEATGAEVCIKVLVPEANDDESVQRFRREAYAVARLSHRAIVRVFDLVELGPDGEQLGSGGAPSALAMVMELLRGETLGDHLMKRGKLSVDETLDIAIPFLSALAHAHRAGVVHRDVKPDNLFLSIDPDEHVLPKVLDFGISKVKVPNAETLTLDGVLLGTPSFMSPEQARGSKNIDARSDVFSSGILLYMMLAGENPFESDSFHSVVSAVLEREPPPIAGLPGPLWAVLAKALAKAPADRYADATEFGIALRRAAGRAVITESGLHGVARARADSVLSVPPVDPAGSESGVRAPLEGRGAARGWARRRRITLVISVVAAAAVLAFVAFVRSSAPPSAASSAPTGASESEDLTGSHTAAGVASAEAPALDDEGEEGGSVGAAAAPASAAAPAAPRARPPALGAPSAPPSAARRPLPGPSAAAKPETPPPPPATAPREIARDPGF
jgi:eukaryotic-like serine/threonine-protein kinase